jgi:hypothetical protein
MMPFDEVWVYRLQKLLAGSTFTGKQTLILSGITSWCNSERFSVREEPLTALSTGNQPSAGRRGD